MPIARFLDSVSKLDSKSTALVFLHAIEHNNLSKLVAFWDLYEVYNVKLWGFFNENMTLNKITDYVL